MMIRLKARYFVCELMEQRKKSPLTAVATAVSQVPGPEPPQQGRYQRGGGAVLIRAVGAMGDGGGVSHCYDGAAPDAYFCG